MWIFTLQFSAGEPAGRRGRAVRPELRRRPRSGSAWRRWRNGVRPTSVSDVACSIWTKPSISFAAKCRHSPTRNDSRGSKPSVWPSLTSPLWIKWSGTRRNLHPPPLRQRRRRRRRQSYPLPFITTRWQLEPSTTTSKTTTEIQRPGDRSITQHAQVLR